MEKEMNEYFLLGESYQKLQWQEEVDIQQNRLLTDEVSQRNPNFDSRRISESELIWGSEKSLNEFLITPSMCSSIRHKPDMTQTSIKLNFDQEDFL